MRVHLEGNREFWDVRAFNVEDGVVAGERLQVNPRELTDNKEVWQLVFNPDDPTHRLEADYVIEKVVDKRGTYFHEHLYALPNQNGVNVEADPLSLRAALRETLQGTFALPLDFNQRPDPISVQPGLQPGEVRFHYHQVLGNISGQIKRAEVTY